MQIYNLPSAIKQLWDWIKNSCESYTLCTESGKKDKSTALQIILYTVWLIIASLLPVLGYTGKLFITPFSAVIVFLLGLWMLFYAVKLYQTRTSKSAKTLMLVSVSYITLLQLVYILDKFLR